MIRITRHSQSASDRSPRLYCWACWLALALAALVTAGCSAKAGPLLTPPVKVSQASARAFEFYDTNKDGLLDETELAAAPSLRQSLARIDANHDGKISLAELTDRLNALYKRRLATIGVVTQVVENGRPLAGATVTFVPEEFLGPAIKPSQGVTDAQGIARPAFSDDQTPGPPIPGIQFGYYRVEVSKEAAGKQLIGAKFNTQTTLGQEVAADAENLRGMLVLKVAR